MFIDQFLNTHYEKECSSPENSLVAVPSPIAQVSPLIPTPEVVRM